MLLLLLLVVPGSRPAIPASIMQQVKADENPRTRFAQRRTDASIPIVGKRQANHALGRRIDANSFESQHPARSVYWLYNRRSANHYPLL